ncbi:MAG: response regulator [Bdellovibrionales bacterium]|nr:response regulator [Bdellovibrionales bacterium]
MVANHELGNLNGVLTKLLWELQEPLVLLDRTHRCLAISQGFQTTFHPEDGETRSGGAPESPSKILDEVWPEYKKIRLSQTEFTIELLMRGETREVEVKCQLITNDLYLLSFVSSDEATRFFHQQRLQTLGLLAGGVAHDFNNILAGILGHITFLQAVLPAEGPHSESLEAITGGAKKASTLTKQILDFSKFDLEEENPTVDLVDLVSSTAPLLRGALTSAIELRLELPEEPQVVVGSEGKIAQILVNLVINARDAVDHGGIVDVRVHSNVTRSDLPPALRNSAADRYVLLEVEDNGVGMSEQVKRRALEPYFSTKGDQGTGLGLATVASILETFEGALQIESSPGVGTSIRVFLRRIGEMDDHVPNQERKGEKELPRGDERVLVVDDEEAVRSVVAMSLRHLGYEVEELSDPREARNILKASAVHYDLVVLDMLMPHLSGEELFFDFRTHRPKLPALIMSGYSEEGAIDRVLRQPYTRFIHKPFTVEDLSREVRECLDNFVFR